MAIVLHRRNEQDQAIIADITKQLNESLPEWYGEGWQLRAAQPEIRSYRNCFILSYPITDSGQWDKHILVKIRRNSKMDSLWRAIAADIHANIPTEYGSLIIVFRALEGVDNDFGVIRPLAYLEKYHAIVMEEYPSQTLRNLLLKARASKKESDKQALMDAAFKTGKWLHYFHRQMHTAEATKYSAQDVLTLVEGYAKRVEGYNHGRVQAQSILNAFAQKLENVQLESIMFSQSHADMTCDNVLYSEEGKVCVIDIKTRLAPIYSDLGLILTHPETLKPQIFSRGAYFSKSLLKEYRAAIQAGYFGGESQDEYMVKLFSATKVLDKWTMYEELMSKYKGMKYIISRPLGPFVTSYFQGLLKKYLDSIDYVEVKQAIRAKKSDVRPA